MKKIELTSMSIRNFKGVRELDITLGHRTTITGANATGKSTIFDAFTWLLFGKDSQDRTDSGKGAFAIKTLDIYGRVIEKLTHEVSATIERNGETITLKRRLSERWVKKSRAKEATFEGNSTTCEWNGVEIGTTEWNARIERELLPIKNFKMLTNPHYFSSLPWQEQLTELTRMIGSVTAEDVAQGNAEFEAALAGIPTSTTLKERLTAISTEHRRWKKRLDEIPSEIKGINAATPEAPNYGELECEQNALLQEQERLDAAQRSATEAERQHYEAIKAKQAELHTIENRQFEVYAAALAEANQQASEANAQRSELASRVSKAESERDRYTAEMNATQQRLNSDTQILSNRERQLQSERTRLLNEWHRIDAQQFPADAATLICPMTKQPCGDPSAQEAHRADADAALHRFNEKKIADLTEIERQGMAVKEQLEKIATDRLRSEQGAQSTLGILEAQRDAAAAEATSLRQQLDATTEQPIKTSLDKKGIPAWMALHEQAEALRFEIQTLENSEAKGDDQEVVQHKREIRQRLDTIAAELAKEQLISDNAAKVAALKEESDRVAQQMADLEQEQETIKALEKAIIDEVERRANALFERVKFHTCEWQINGEPVQTCYATMDGVKYADLNSAGQTNAGLDIIKTLCRQYEVCAPIFIDNAEGVNTLTETDSQQVRLVVTTDRPLQVKIEQA